MKNIVISSVIMALLVLTGCSSKEGAIKDDTQAQETAKEVAAVETETVTDGNASVLGENGEALSDSNEMVMANIEKELQSVYFDFDKFNIRTDMQEKVSQDAVIAKGAALAYTIKLEGNCDEWGSDEYNFALGLKRADSVKKSLVAEGVDATRVTMVSYGESNQVCNDKTRECWAKNRRVDFKLLP